MDEMTFFDFYSLVKSYISKLLKGDVTAHVDDYLREHGIKTQALLSVLLDSNILSRTEKIKTDIDGKDRFFVKYTLHRKDFRDKVKKIYKEMVDEKTVNETTDASVSGQYTQPVSAPIMRRTIYLNEDQYEYVKKCLKETDCSSSGQYTAPCFADKNDPAYNHKNLITRKK